MNRDITNRRQNGTILIMVLILIMALGFLVTFFLSQSQVQARAARFRLGSMRALYDAYSELEKAKTVIAQSAYTADGHNEALQTAVARGDRIMDGTNVEVARMTGVDGTWYSLTATVPYENAERVVTQAVREIDFFSSYNLFVSEDPAGISGSPIGAIHSNKGIQFYFPDGVYKHSVTAVEGVTHKSGATPANTQVLGPFNPAAQRIDIDYNGTDRFNMNYIQANTDPQFVFDDTMDLKVRLYIFNNEQWAHLERWSKPKVETVTENVLMGYNNVNPREETYNWMDHVRTGSETRTRDVQILDHNDTVQDPVNVPIYVSDVRMITVPVYRNETRTREVPIYRNETRYRTVVRRVWIVLSGGSGGTAVGGDSGQLGYWADQEVQEPYTVQVLDHMETQSYTASVFDHNEDRPENYQRLDHYEMQLHPRIVPVYRTETQSYEQDVFEDILRTGTHTVYDQEPIYQMQTRTVYTPSALNSSADKAIPENGLIYAAGNITSLQGNMIERVTVATRGSAMITGDLLYKDQNGNLAYLNGKKPWLEYSPNPEYKNRATLGVIAQNDVLLSRTVPDNLELNASILAMEGRVGIEGIVLDGNGEVESFNQLKDEFGRAVVGEFRKNSIRRLGGITTAKRPVETVVKDGSIRSGFNVGNAVFDIGLLEGPPPFFLPYPVPRFFSTVVTK